MTKTMTALDARRQFFELLDEAQAGTEIVIERDSRPVACVIPFPQSSLSEEEVAKQHEEAIEGLRRLRKQFAAKDPPLTFEEMMSARHEGHRY